MKIVYLAQELGDAAIARRITMLSTGGAEVKLVGFLRDRTGLPKNQAATVIGKTEDRKLVKRVFTVLGALRRLYTGQALAGADVVLARNLEMLLLAVATRRRKAKAPAIVYECLDVHSIMLGKGAVSAGLRLLERWLLRSVGGVITSSPAFIDNYLRGTQGFRGPIELVENKFTPAAAMVERPPYRDRSPPWRIGWFGVLRCAKSVQILAALARELPDSVHVVLRGVIGADIAPLVEEACGRLPNVRYEGRYSYPQDIPGMYGAVDFCWAIDFYEEGHNSKWLLPNRLYESLSSGAVPIAVAGVTTAEWLLSKGVGVVLDQPLLEQAVGLMGALKPSELESLRAAVHALPLAAVIVDAAQCRELVATIGSWADAP